MPHLISFDIDGTLVTGNGPGPITLDMVRRALEHGHIIGSCSDRPVQDQKNMWAAAGIEVSFTVLKHKMGDARAQVEADEYYHVGSADRDNHYTALSGFTFLPVQTTTGEAWMIDAHGNSLPPNTDELSQAERARLG